MATTKFVCASDTTVTPLLKEIFRLGISLLKRSFKPLVLMNQMDKHDTSHAFIAAMPTLLVSVARISQAKTFSLPVPLTKKCGSCFGPIASVSCLSYDQTKSAVIFI